MKKMIGWAAGGLVLIGVGVWAFPILFEGPHVSQGRALFAKYCASCHGVKGRGNGFNAPHLDPQARDLTDSIEPYMAEGTNEDIFSAIASGVAAVAPAMGEGHEHVHKHGDGENSEEEEEGFGSPLMPYWGFTLSDQEIWSLVAYIRTLHKNDAPPVEFNDQISAQRKRPVVAASVELPSLDSPQAQKLAAEGKTLLEERYACTACHEVNGEGGKAGPPLDRAGVRLNPDWIYRWIQDPKSIKREATMPAFGLPDEEAKAITLYLMTLQAEPEAPAS